MAGTFIRGPGIAFTLTRVHAGRLRELKRKGTGRELLGAIILSYEKFRIRSSANINRAKVASGKVLSANLAYANTVEQSG